MFLNGSKFTKDDLPITFGDNDFEYKVLLREENEENLRIKVVLGQDSAVIFTFYKHFLHIKVSGNSKDFYDSVGLMGDFHTGAWRARDGSLVSTFDEFGLEWQVRPTDAQLFRDKRSPQLPAEQCRMPSTTGSISRRMLRADKALVEEATTACVGAGHVRKNLDLCIQDVVATGHVGLANAW